MPSHQLSYEKLEWGSHIGGSGVNSILLLPEQPVDEPPLLIISGLGATAQMYMSLAAELAAEHSRIVALFEPPRTQNPIAAVRSTHRSDVLAVQSQAAKRTLDGVTERTGATSFDVLGHSLGFPKAVRLARHLPKGVIRSVVSDAGAHLDGNTGGIQMSQIAGLLSEIKTVTGDMYSPDEKWPFLMGGIHHFFRQPSRIVRELHEGVKGAPRTIEGVFEIRERGVRIASLLPEHDSLFKPDDVLMQSGHLLHHCEVIPGALHTDANLISRAKVHAEFVIRALTVVNQAVAENPAA